MKSNRIRKIEGNFMGVEFYVKPTPLNVNEVEEKHRDMLMGWYEQNYPSTADKLKGDTEFSQYTEEDIKALNAWRLDVDFRSEYLKSMAEACMAFTKPISGDTWKRDDLEYSTIREAWDFFCEKRLVP